MNLAQSHLLWWIPPIAGIIVVLYLLRMKRKDFRVPATFLWTAQTEEIRANTWFQKLKFSWLMVLQLLALLLLGFAFAQPQILRQGLDGKITVLIIDASASMQATDVRPTRMAEAMRIASGVIARAKFGDQISLIEAGPTPRVIFSASGDPATMRRKLQSIEPSDAPCDMGEALRLAVAITRKKEGSRIILLSDGVFDDVEDFASTGAEIAFVPIGESGKNVGITALKRGKTNDGPVVFANVENFSLDPAQGEIDFYADGKLFRTSQWQARPSQATGVTVPAPADATVIEARIKSDDYLQSDNHRFAVESRAHVRTLLVSNGAFFTERVLSLDPRIDLYKSTTVPTGGDWDLCVFDGVAERPVKAAAVLTMGAAGPETPVSVLGSISGPMVVQASQPYREGIDWEGAYIESAQRVKPNGTAKVLASFNGSPALLASEAGGKRRMYLAFSPMRSDFPLQAGFPVFMAEAVDWLAPASAIETDLQVDTGRTISFSAKQAAEIDVTFPGGAKSKIKAHQGAFLLRDVRQSGEYRIGSRKLFANLASPLESKIAPNQVARIAGKPVKGVQALTTLRDYWRWFGLAALFILGAEWLLFVRKS